MTRGGLVSGLRLIRALIVQDLTARWSGAALTWGWILLQPLAQIALFSLVFGRVLVERGHALPTPGTYVVYVSVGVFLWTGVSEAIIRGGSAIRTRASMVKGRGIPPFFLTLSAVLTAWCLAAIGLTLSLGAALVVGIVPTWAWLLLPIPCVALVLISLGAALVLSPLFCLVRDVEQATHLMLPLLFWSAPIVYDPSQLPIWMRVAECALPLTAPLITAHELIIEGSVAGPALWGIMVCFAGGALALGIWVFARCESEVRDVI